MVVGFPNEIVGKVLLFIGGSQVFLYGVGRHSVPLFDAAAR